MDSHEIRNAVVEHVAASHTKITPPQLEKTVSNRYGLTKTQFKALIKDLISSGELIYIYEYGSTFLAKSFNKPVRISSHVVIMPVGHSYPPAPGEVVIQIKPGAAFGAGRHPTTRLSIKAIEYVLKIVSPDGLNRPCSVLDIGTGSGILAMAAVCLGIKTGLGIDIDSCAIVEARENIALNHLQHRLIISDRKIDAVDQVFTMVIANLRPPSLKNYYPQISKLTDTGGWVVLSGFRPHEHDHLMGLYTANYFKCIWSDTEIGWTAAVLKKI